MTGAPGRPVAIVLAAGKGTRMISVRPKVLFPILGRPLVRRVVDAAIEAGCSDVVVVVGHGAEQVEDALGALPGLRFARQEGMQGTGEAVAAARGALDWSGRTVLVLPGDVPLITPGTIGALIQAHSGRATVATMFPADPRGYGRIVREGGSVRAIVEQRDATPSQLDIGEVNTGIYAFSGDFLFGPGGKGGALAELSTDNAQREYLLTDVIGIAVARGERVGGMPIEDSSCVAGVNDRAQLADLERRLREQVALRWMKAGVSMDEPASVRIEEAVLLAPDVVLGAGVELRGCCVIGGGAEIGRGSVLLDVEVGEGARIGPYVVAERARVAACAVVHPFSVLRGVDEKKPAASTEADLVLVGTGARVGPFAHLRQASDLGPGVHVGNFVELKKTRMEEGAKANHLAYLGDAEIGARSNIGAGVITCNYDGFAKHRTRVGAEAFVGTDSHLVAPVKVGARSYVATGTTVTRDVPEDALAISRTRQENKEGYAPPLRAQLQSRARRLAETEARRKTERDG